MKKLIALLTITALIVLSLTACGSANENNDRSGNSSQIPYSELTPTDDGKETDSSVLAEQNTENTPSDAVTNDTDKDAETKTTTDTQPNAKAANTENTSSVAKDETKAKVSAAPAANNTQTKTPATAKDTTPAPQTKNNIFINENNNYYNQDSITINPRYVYWDNGKLHAECFVINGFSHNVFNLNVKSIKISNTSGVIASAAFGNLNGVTLAPHTNIVWTFEFSADCVMNSGADLSSLTVDASVSNNY